MRENIINWISLTCFYIIISLLAAFSIGRQNNLKKIKGAYCNFTNTTSLELTNHINLRYKPLNSALMLSHKKSGQDIHSVLIDKECSMSNLKHTRINYASFGSGLKLQNISLEVATILQSIPLEQNPFFLPVLMGIAGLMIYLFFVAFSSKKKVKEVNKNLKKLIEAKEKAEEMNKVKSNFLANMSHELRTPLIGILGYGQILANEIDDKDKLEMIDAINYSGERLLKTVNLILDLSKIESNKLDLLKESLNLSEIAEQSLNQLLPLINKKGLELIVDIQKNIIIYSDKNAVISIINNIFTNAVKYTEKGSVKIEIKKAINEKKNNFVEIKVKDTGIGISKENLSKIFEEFRQASEGYSRKYEGTGLGLTITKKLVDALGGDINVASEIGKGTTFIIKLPDTVQFNPNRMVKDEIAVNDFNQNTSVSKFNLLLLEDDFIAQKIIKRFLKEVGEVDVVAKVEDALQAGSNKNYDAFLVDINLGDKLTGIDFVENLKEDASNKDKPMIAVTAYAMKEDRERLLSLGFTHYISKPFVKNEIVRLVMDVLNIDHPENITIE